MTQQRNISPRQAQAWLSAGDAILIDVREPDEFKAGHIACATSLPLATLYDALKQMPIPTGKKIIFQCLRGKRGEQACALIPPMNTTHDVYNMDGGIDGWTAAGLPVVQSTGVQRPIFRQVQIIVGSFVLVFVLLGYSGQNWAFAGAGVLGTALAFAGVTGWCGLAMALARMPWNKK